jgi:peptidoglycan/xylan/chitin deacetylase (PgdA/CDA1 family)
MVTFDDGYRDFAAHAWPVMRDLAIPATLFVATAFASDPTTPFWWDSLWTALHTADRGTSVATPHGTLPAGPDAAMNTMGRLRDWLKTLEHDDAMAEVDRIVATLVVGVPAPEPAVLGWDELRALAADGVTLAPHTRHHPLLDRVPLERAVDEIAGSLADLEREVGGVASIPPVLAYPSGAHGGSAPEAARRAGMVLAVTTVRGGNDLRHADPLRLRRINVGGRTSTALLRAQLVWAATIDVARRRA